MKKAFPGLLEKDGEGNVKYLNMLNSDGSITRNGETITNGYSVTTVASWYVISDFVDTTPTQYGTRIDPMMYSPHTMNSESDSNSNEDKDVNGVNVPKEKKIPVSGKTGKEAAKDVPSWVKEQGEAPYVDEDGKTFAERVLDQQYGKGEWNKGKASKGPGSDFNKIKKWGDRGFEIKKKNKMKNFIYTFEHIYTDKSHTDCKLLGFFDDLDELERIKHIVIEFSGFKDYPDGFIIKKNELNKVHWENGFEEIAGEIGRDYLLESDKIDETYLSVKELGLESIFSVSHSYTVNRHLDDERFIGVFSSGEKAEKAIEKLKKQSGFIFHPDDFDISEIEMNDLLWKSGF